MTRPNRPYTLILIVAVILFMGYMLALTGGHVIFGSRTVTTTRPDGTLRFVTEVDSQNRPHGKEREYYPNGKLRGEYIYYHGDVTGYTIYWPSGRMQTRMYETLAYGVVVESFSDMD